MKCFANAHATIRHRLHKRLRDVVGALVKRAQELLHEAGHPTTEATMERVRGTLTADLAMNCARCLADLQTEVTGEVVELFSVPVDNPDEGEEVEAGYEIVFTPHIGKADLWETSGHLGFYRENMFSGMDVEGQEHEIGPDDVQMVLQPLEGYQVERAGTHAVALNLELDDELRREGLAREVVHAVVPAGERRRAFGDDVVRGQAREVGGGDGHRDGARGPQPLDPAIRQEFLEQDVAVLEVEFALFLRQHLRLDGQDFFGRHGTLPLPQRRCRR